MRQLLAMLLLAAGPATANAPLLFAPLCEDGEIVGLRIGVFQALPAGTEVSVRWASDICKGRDA